ncbi:aldehyde dehydrogenase family protein [Hahella sp. KA22]|uniref:aldehyde dehydrogenase family protein n=1 Tax=Hahella sp. KA22 TaxID=1628392 RepID=UPI000FDE8EDB|nr:aldehyde dehydrogenase family protein [Hahella sp. KA22]AZZ90194.1 aldehyde dehydrogenase family protein [Hahella sp. KA22]QAY53564.1 aldehyde dehydrogenase family protein [Hahella sp. KA22]
MRIISPIDGTLVAEREPATAPQIHAALERALTAQKIWRTVSIAERARYCRLAIAALAAQTREIAPEITLLMGRPVRETPREIKEAEVCAEYMIDIAERYLEDIITQPKTGFRRYIRREPLGVVLCVAPWSHPYLAAANAIIPALMAGNCVILKHSIQTLLCAERFSHIFFEAGLPDSVFQHLHVNDADTLRLISDQRISHVSFMGSSAKGVAIERAAAGTLKKLTLELGGSNPAYVFSDASLRMSASGIAKGALFNCGQSNRAIKRIYAHEDIYEDFLDALVAQAKCYKLANPMDPSTTLGPMVSPQKAMAVKTRLDAAIAQGATPCIEHAHYSNASLGPAYLPPQVLTNVDHSMALMTSETFGPVMGVMKVKDDAEAVHYMNDSLYGLRASLWTQDIARAQAIGEQLQTGAVLMNQSTHIDPALAWGGVKQSGCGSLLSELAYTQLTQAKSYYLRIA